MVTAIMERQNYSKIVNRPNLVVELVGPAGAGKTSLVQALKQHSNRVQVGTPPYFRRIGHMPFFVKNTLLLLPTFFHLLQKDHGRWLTLQEMAWMVILKGWHKVLGRTVSQDNKILVLDQGPIFLLARLYGFGPEILKSQGTKKWWNNMYRQWADMLNLAIWVDASDTTLLKRVRTREIWHGNKERNDLEAFEFLARWRISLEQVISALEANGSGLKVIRFDTARESLHEIVHRVYAALSLKNS